MKPKYQNLLGALALLAFSILHIAAFAQGTAFTYQGRLNDGAVPANGIYDLRFTIYDSTNNPGTIVAGPLTNSATGVSNGLFTVALDFGSSFPGADRFLEIAVRTNGSALFSALAPRQKLTPTPYAITAGSVVSGGISAGIYSNIVAFNNAANSFAGNGSSLTGLNGNNISSGTISDARLSGNVALRDANQTFTGVNTFTHPSNSFTGIFNGSFAGNGNGLTNVNLMTVSPAFAITLTTNVGGFGLTLDSAPFAGSYPASIINADVNGDGKPDLISVSQDSGTVSVLTNNGSGKFTLASTFTAGPFTFTGSDLALNLIASGDVNGDGKIDLITADSGASHFSVFTNDGRGGFSFSFFISQSAPAAVIAGDFNHDGRADLICASSGFVNVLTNNGAAGFAQSVSFSVAATPDALTLADLNGDSLLDLVVAFTSTEGAQVFLGDSKGGFSPYSSIPQGAEIAVAADVNGDHKPDLIIPAGFNFLLIYTNDGSGFFPSSNFVAFPNGISLPAAADINNDGRMDLLVSAQPGGIYVSTNDGFGNFTLALQTVITPRPFALLTTDLNGDGTTDVALAAFQSAGTISVFLNTLGLVTTSATFQGNFSGTALNVTGNLVAGNLSGNGSGLTNLNADTISSGTLSDNRLSENVALLNRTQAFTGQNTFNNAGNIFAGNGASLTSLAAGNISSGSLTDARLSANVALLNASQTFTGTNVFNSGSSPLNPGLRVTDGLNGNLNLQMLAGGNSGYHTINFNGFNDGTEERYNTGKSRWRIVVDQRSATDLMTIDNFNGVSVANLVAIQTNGNLGIGTTSPQGSLHVYSTNNPTVARIQSTGTPGFGRVEFVSNPQGDVNEWRPGFIQSIDNGGFTGGLGFFVNGTGSGNKFGSIEVMRVINGNVGIGITSPTNKLHVAGGVSATAFVNTSDRNAKENFAAVSPVEVLDKVLALPITTWNFKELHDGRHMGPMAQDFYAAFGLGASDKTITSVDPDGVALAAIQGLNQKLAEKLEQKKSEITELKRKNDSLEKRVDALEKLIRAQQSN